MSIIIQFNTVSFISSVPSKPSSVLRTKDKLEMVPGIDHTDRTVMTDDESSMVDIATSNTLYTHEVNNLKTNHVFGSCFGLPYQDHNYGAPPPPTPPNYSPCASPSHDNSVPDEDTNLSVVSTSTANEETQEGSITRCICGFEHDDEYMICCDLCLVWQHVDCMGLDRNSIPETYLCEKCEPRKVDKHKAKVLQTRKKVAMTDSSDSDEGAANQNTERKPKFRSKRKKKDDEKNEKTEHVTGKRNKQQHKNNKERMEAKRSKLRRTKSKESTSTADEEAQDAWEISLEWCEKNFEPALNNQYTPEVQQLTKTVPLLGYEKKFMELLLTRHCKIIDGDQKKLISIYDIPRDQPLIEYVGKFLLASQFHELHPVFSRRLFPFVLFYTLQQQEICVDASVYGNEARFVRRSCKPNAEIRHLVHNGNLHLYIASTKAVFKDDEITLPLDFNLKEGIKDLECACESEECILKYRQKNGNIDACQDKRKRGKKITFSADDDSSHSVGLNSPSKLKSPVKSANEQDGKSDHESEEQTNEQKKKTREERKIDAIMRAFDQMEKAAKRRQQALERQKAHFPKSEESSEKTESSKEVPKEEDKCNASSSETQGGEDEKVFVPTPKPKKGKRRRGSGTSRRRTRTNSGGADVLSSEDSTIYKITPATSIDEAVNSETSVEASSIGTNINVTTNVVPSTTTSASSPVVLKTKRFLLHEWLQEKSETNINSSTTSPVSIRTEVKWNTSAASPTCYVQCTKDNPHSSGISAAHLRRSSTSSQIKSYPQKTVSEQGSAKKRWLRQAMCDSNTDPLTIDPGGLDGLSLDNGYLSPSYHGEMGSPGTVEDTITPLKKRRLLRESQSSPLSPTSNSDASDVKDTKTENITIKIETEQDESLPHLSSDIKIDSLELTQKLKDNTLCKINGLKVEGVEVQQACIKEEKDPCDLFEKSFPVENKDSSESINPAFSDCKENGLSMHKDCDVNEKVQKFENGFIQKDNSDILLNTCESEQICNTKTMQSNLLTCNNSTSDKTVETVECKNTLSYKGVKRKIDFISDSSSALHDNCKKSKTCDNSECKNEDFKSDINLSISSVEVDHLASEQKLHEEIVHTSSKENICNASANCKSPKEKPLDYPVKNSELHASALLLKNVINCVDTSLNTKSEQNSNKNLTNIENNNSELVCSNSSSEISVNSSDIKSNEISYLNSKTSNLNEDQNLASKGSPLSATQKKKVSLSEYRMRMKDNSNKRSSTDTIKKKFISSALSTTVVPETLPEQVTLAPLPLFDTTVDSKSPIQTSKNTKKKKEVNEEEIYDDVIEYRENLTERLKREFGLGVDDDDDDSTKGLTSSDQSKSTSLLLCAQPPPPPPPRILRPPQSSLNVAAAASPTQFGYPMPTSYARTSYIVPQVPSAQFIPVQQPAATTGIPSMHPITAPSRVQCNVRPPLLPSPHSFAPTLQGTVLQPSIQCEYSPVNAQNFSALVQQHPPPPPPPPPKSYSHVYQPNLFK